jgi:hypothetical protein
MKVTIEQCSFSVLDDLIPGKKRRSRNPVTHIAYTPKLENGKFAGWLEIGSAWRNQQGSFDIQFDRMPADFDNFTGYVRLAPIGATSPPPDPDDQMTEEP